MTIPSCSSRIADTPERVILIGLDGANFPVMAPLLLDGHLPTTGEIIDQGIAGSLAVPFGHLWMRS